MPLRIVSLRIFTDFLYRTKLTVRIIHIPNAIDRKALEDDVKEDGEPRRGK